MRSLIFLLLCTPAFADPTTDLLKKVQQYYDSTKELKAKFDQSLESAIGGRPKKASGEVCLKKPGRMRWDYQKPDDDKKIIVADGKTLWMYQPDDNQAFKQPLTASSLPAQVSFLVGEGKLSDEFDPSMAKVDAVPEGDVAVKLVPKTGTSAYRYVVFVVEAKSGQVARTIIYDTSGGTNTLTFSDVQQNKGCPDDRFKFAPPAGTKIIKAP